MPITTYHHLANSTSRIYKKKTIKNWTQKTMMAKFYKKEGSSIANFGDTVFDQKSSALSVLIVDVGDIFNPKKQKKKLNKTKLKKTTCNLVTNPLCIWLAPLSIIAVATYRLCKLRGHLSVTLFCIVSIAAWLNIFWLLLLLGTFLLHIIRT